MIFKKFVESVNVRIVSMRTTGAWAFRRQIIYGTFFATITILGLTFLYFKYLYVAPDCFDGVQDENEEGVDCGGACVRICNASVTQPVVKWSRSFRVTPGLYNAVAYIENLNRVAATSVLNYTFSLYDDDGLITERKGSTILPPNSIYPIFEGRIETGNRVPTRTFLEFEAPRLWQPSETGREQFTVTNRELVDADQKPKLLASITNNSLKEAKEVEVVATIFDTNRNALTSSRTYIDNFAPRAETDVAFTWPEPIAKTVRSCEIPTDVVVAIDLSGSMNNDNDNPPQPISAVKKSASAFINRLGDKDQVSVVTFATEAALTVPLTSSKASAASIVAGLSIDPEEETGSTNTGEALRVSGTELFSERHDVNARKVLVILTDGLATAPDEDPEGYALEIAGQAGQYDIEVYAIGLGEQVNMEFIRQIASSPNYAYQALTQSDVDRIYQTITSSICEDGAAIIDIVAKTDEGFIPLR